MRTGICGGGPVAFISVKGVLVGTLGGQELRRALKHLLATLLDLEEIDAPAARKASSCARLLCRAAIFAS